MRTRTKAAAIGAAIAVLTVGVAPMLSGAADHLEAPLAVANHSLDITDIYAFDGANSKKTVLVMDVNPLVGPVSGRTFSTTGEYRFNIDRDGDYVADDIYTVKFASGGPGGKQLLTLWKNGNVVLNGKTGNANNGGGAKLYAGVRDDPFFFDLASFKHWRDPDGVGPFTYDGPTTFDGIDFFRGTNITAIVLEIPDGWLGASANYWGSTMNNGAVIDRMGKPALATVFINPFGGTSDKDAYNATAPSSDPATWGGLFTAVENVFYGDPGVAAAISGTLLPDVLHLDVAHLGKSTGTSFLGDTAGHLLNGRTLAEDVIDGELTIVTGGIGCIPAFAGLPCHPILTTDGVPSNDAAFPGSFPYLASPH